MAHGRSVYLKHKELEALRDSASEWCDMMNEGDEQSQECVTDRMNNGLGSALKKLYKGLGGDELYKDY